MTSASAPVPPSVGPLPSLSTTQQPVTTPAPVGQFTPLMPQTASAATVRLLQDQPSDTENRQHWQTVLDHAEST